jgi:hypothetical protein
MTRKAAFVMAWTLVALVPAAHAQTSASYTMQEYTINAGGRPSQGTITTSASFRVTLDAIGDGVIGSGLSSDSYKMAAGFAAPHRPAGEVMGLIAKDHRTFQWDWEPTSTAFNFYRDPLSLLPTEFGACLASRATTNSWGDASVPAAGTGWFYLVTGENLLWEEGTMGAASSGAERPNTAPCP